MGRVKTEITYREYVKQLITFLKRSGTLKRYKEEILKQHQSCFSSLYNYINPLSIKQLSFDIERGYIEDVIDHAFTWSESDEGHDFWSQLNESWHNKMRDKVIVPEKI